MRETKNKNEHQTTKMQAIEKKSKPKIVNKQKNIENRNALRNQLNNMEKTGSKQQATSKR